MMARSNAHTGRSRKGAPARSRVRAEVPGHVEVEDPIAQLDGKIDLFLDFMAQRRGRDRNTGTASEIAARFRTDIDTVKRVMQAAWARNMVTFYPSGQDVYYVRRTDL